MPEDGAEAGSSTGTLPWWQGRKQVTLANCAETVTIKYFSQHFPTWFVAKVIETITQILTISGLNHVKISSLALPRKDSNSSL